MGPGSLSRGGCMMSRAVESLLGRGPDGDLVRAARPAGGRSPRTRAGFVVLAGLLTLGCESLLDLNHDYAVRTQGTGGNSGGSGSGLTHPSLTGGATSAGAGGSSSTTSAVGGAGAGGSTSATATSGGVGTGGSASVASAGGHSGGWSSSASSTGAGGTGGVSSTTGGQTSAGGDATGGFSSATGGQASGGVNSSRTSAGGVATGGLSSAASGGLGSGGTHSTRASTGGAVTGGSSSAPRTTGGSSTGGETAGATGGAASGGASNCTACSHAITLQSESATAQRGSNSASGVTYYAHLDRCPGGQVLIGYGGTLRDDVYLVSGAPVLQLASLVAICGRVTLEASGEVTVTPSSGIEPRGTDATAGTFSQICPTDQVVVGFAGRAGSIIDQIGVVSASLQSASAGCCCSALTLGSTYSFTPVGGTGGSAYSESCSSGQVALGQSLYTATTTKHPGEEWVSRFGLLCGTPMPDVACEI